MTQLDSLRVLLESEIRHTCYLQESVGHAGVILECESFHTWTEGNNVQTACQSYGQVSSLLYHKESHPTHTCTQRRLHMD